MIVQELKEILDDCNPDALVIISYHGYEQFTVSRDVMSVVGAPLSRTVTITAV